MRAQGRPISPEALGLGVRDRALARRFLGPLHAAWHDGDENLVRGYLDRWTVAGGDASSTAARALLEAAEALPMGARAEALWFYLWEMESMLESVAR